MKIDYVGHETAYRRIKAEGGVGWDRTEAAYAQRFEQLRRILAEGLAPRTGRLLELGCGAGNISVWLASRGYSVTGVDISETAIAWSRERAHEQKVDVDFRVGNVLSLDDFPEASFDLVLDGHCLHCIIGPDRARFFETARRLLRQGGYLLVDTMCGPVAPEALQGYDEKSRCTIVNGIASRYFGLPDDIRKEITRAGFEILAELKTEASSHGHLVIQAEKRGPTRQMEDIVA